MVITPILVYFLLMKFLILLLVIAISTQPLQAGFCGMDLEKSQESAHHVAPSDNSGHDCCDPGGTDSQDGCDSDMKCGPCFVSVPVLPAVMKVTPLWSHAFLPGYSAGVVLPSHSSPPFRPPIS